MPTFSNTLTAEAAATTANVVLVARRSGDQLGFGVAFRRSRQHAKRRPDRHGAREDGSGPDRQ